MTKLDGLKRLQWNKRNGILVLLRVMYRTQGDKMKTQIKKDFMTLIAIIVILLSLISIFKFCLACADLHRENIKVEKAMAVMEETTNNCAERLRQ